MTSPTTTHLESFRKAVEEYSSRVEDLERLVGEHQAAVEAQNTGEADRLQGAIEELLAELNKRKADIDAQSEQLEKERDRAAELIV